jgi:hypothetical protein
MQALSYVRTNGFLNVRGPLTTKYIQMTSS